MNGALKDFIAVFRHWRVWFLMANQDVVLRYRRSILGPFWISLAMVALVVGIGLLYSRIFHLEFRDFLAFLGPSLLAWYFLSGMLTEATYTVIENESHLKGVPIPIPVFSARMVYRNLIVFAHNLIVVLILLLVVGHFNAIVMPLALVGVALYCIFGFALGLILGPLSARYRDIPQLVNSTIQLLFFITPVMWKPSQLSSGHPAVQANPFAHLLALVREPMLGHVPSMMNWAVSLITVAAALVVALVSLSLTRRKIFLWL